MASQDKENRKPQERDPERNFERVKRRRTRRTVNRHLITALIIVFLTLAFAALVVGIFFRVSDIKVNGNTYYNDQDIKDSSGIEYGRNIYLVDNGKVATTLISQFPFIKTVKLTRDIPSTIVINVECDEAMYYTEIKGEYFIISRELRVVGREKTLDDVASHFPTVKRLVTSDISEAIVGRELVFVRENYFEEAKSIVATICESDIFETLTTVDITDKFAIKVIYNHTVKATLGDSSDFDIKLRFLQEIIADMAGQGGTVDIENVEMGYVIYSDGESYD